MLNGREHERIPPPENPSWHRELVRIRRTGRGFVTANGTCPEIGDVVTVDKFTAIGLVKMGKAAWVDEHDRTS